MDKTNRRNKLEDVEPSIDSFITKWMGSSIFDPSPVWNTHQFFRVYQHMWCFKTSAILNCKEEQSLFMQFCTKVCMPAHWENNSFIKPSILRDYNPLIQRNSPSLKQLDVEWIFNQCLWLSSSAEVGQKMRISAGLRVRPVACVWVLQ